MEIFTLWDVTPCSTADMYQRFRKMPPPYNHQIPEDNIIATLISTY
jgi:hypothetical protein